MKRPPAQVPMGQNICQKSHGLLTRWVSGPRPHLRLISVLRFWISEGLTQAVNFKGLNDHVHRGFRRNVESTHLSRDNICSDIGRNPLNPEQSTRLKVSPCVWMRVQPRPSSKHADQTARSNQSGDTQIIIGIKIIMISLLLLLLLSSCLL